MPTDQHYTLQVALYLFVALTYVCAVVFVVKARTPLRKWLGASFLVTYLENVVAFPAALFGDERYVWLLGRPDTTFYLSIVLVSMTTTLAGFLVFTHLASAVAPVRSHPTAASFNQHPAIGFDGFFHVVRCGFDRAERERIFRLLHDKDSLVLTAGVAGHRTRGDRHWRRHAVRAVRGCRRRASSFHPVGMERRGTVVAGRVGQRYEDAGGVAVLLHSAGDLADRSISPPSGRRVRGVPHGGLCRCRTAEGAKAECQAKTMRSKA